MGRSEISSMLFNPIIRCPFQSTDEYRDDTLTIGSPIVFQMAPPQPASNARITCSPQFVGGPEASQNGFGHRMPAKFVLRSATQGLRHRRRRALAVRHRVHHLAAAVHAVAAGEVLRIGGPPG